MAIWDIVSPIKVIEALIKVSEGEVEEAGKILTKSAAIGAIKDKVRSSGGNDERSNDDVD